MSAFVMTACHSCGMPYRHVVVCGDCRRKDKRQPPSAFACNAATAVVAATIEAGPDFGGYGAKHADLRAGMAEYRTRVAQDVCDLAEAIQDEIDKRWSGDPR